MEKGNQLINYITVFGFFLILSFPMINGYMQFIPDEKMEENRALSIKPKFDISNLDDYTVAYDEYYSDNFSLRINMINFLNVKEFNLYGISPKPGLVTVGTNDWFFATKSILYHSNQFLYPDEQLALIKRELKERNAWCESKGVKYYTVIVPNKMNIYPEFLPRTILKKQKKGMYDQLVGLNSDPDINIIGLRENLLQHKNDGHLIYQKTDDHWTHFGAYYGYQEIMKTLKKDFPELKIQNLDNFEISISKKDGNMAKAISLTEQFPEEFEYLTLKEKSKVTPGVKKGYKSSGLIHQDEVEITSVNEDGSPFKCLIIRDSFTLMMMRFFNESFQSMVYLHDEWRGRLRKDAVDLEDPDIVIVIILESHAHEILNNLSF